MSKPEYVESWLNNAGYKRGWSGSQVRLTRLELNIYRTDHFRPLAPNPSTSPRAAPRDLGRSRAISGDLGAAPRYLGRSRSVARAASHLLKKEGGWRQEVTPHPERRRRRVCGPRVVARRLLRGAAANFLRLRRAITWIRCFLIQLSHAFIRLSPEKMLEVLIYAHIYVVRALDE